MIGRGRTHDDLCLDHQSAGPQGRSACHRLGRAMQLRVLDLPGIAPPEFITIDAEVSDHGTYTHDEGSMDEWSLTWTKVDGETEVID